MVTHRPKQLTSTDVRRRLRGPLAVAAAAAGLLASLMVAAFAIRGQAWRLIVDAIALVGAIVAAWYAMTRRGTIRVLAATLAVMALAAFVVVTVTGDYRGLAFAGAIVLAGMSALAGRYASGQEPAERAAERWVAGPVRASRPVLIMNPRSGGGKAERFHLLDECRRRGIRAIPLGPGDDLRRLASEAVEQGADLIGMAGGDGSQALVASVAAACDVPYVCVPAGTRNHLALDLGIERDDVVGALDAFAGGIERRIDLGEVNGAVFVNNASMGIYAAIVQSEAYRGAKVKTAADVLPDLIGPDAEPFDLRFTGPDGVEWPYAHMLLVSNNPYRLDRLLGGGQRPRMDTGRLGVAAARIDGPAAAVTFVGLEAAGQIRRFSGWQEWETAALTVHSSGPVDVGLDGEACRMDPPLEFRSRPGALRVRLPGRRPRS